MNGRDPAEEHRASTPLELLFDLCFVVAVAQAAAQLHHALTEAHVGPGLLGYAMVFFAIWWAWMNFTWFASAYDTDDALYRLLTLLQMAGVLTLAAGVPAAFTRYDFTVITIGYVIMRVALVGQWLRAARDHPAGRSAALRYAAGVSLVQVGWLLRLALPHPFDYAGFAVLVAAEIAVPVWAEYSGRLTNWHPGHIAERYGLFTIIVLGEVILAALTGFQSALTEHGLSPQLLLIAIGGLVLVFGLWWIYFTGVDAEFAGLRTALTWGYGHYVVFAAVAALGAGLEVAIDATEHRSHVTEQVAALAVAVPVVVYLLVLAPLHRLTHAGPPSPFALVLAGPIVVLALAFTTALFGLGGTVLAMGLAVAATVSGKLATGRTAGAVPT
jgi:low temperature requirement protein LtrA